jgi:putative oxidoreductase
MPAITRTDRLTRDTQTAAPERAARDTAAPPPPAGAGPGPLADLGLLIGRALVGFVIAAHGWRKAFDVSPAAFGTGTLEPLGVPMPETVGYVVAFTELIGGALLMAGLLTRLAAFALIVDLGFAIWLGKANGPLIVPPDRRGAGMELELALIAGLAVALLAGPGRASVDRALGIDGRWARRRPRT